MNTALHYRLAGMGQSGTQIGHAVAGGVLSSASGYFAQQVQSGELGTGGEIAAAVLGIAATIQNFFFQPDYNKIATTQIVNKAAQLVQPNLTAWQSLSASQKTRPYYPAPAHAETTCCQI